MLGRSSAQTTSDCSSRKGAPRCCLDARRRGAQSQGKAGSWPMVTWERARASIHSKDAVRRAKGCQDRCVPAWRGWGLRWPARLLARILLGADGALDFAVFSLPGAGPCWPALEEEPFNDVRNLRARGQPVPGLRWKAILALSAPSTGTCCAQDRTWAPLLRVDSRALRGCPIGAPLLETLSYLRCATGSARPQVAVRGRLATACAPQPCSRRIMPVARMLDLLGWPCWHDKEEDLTREELGRHQSGGHAQGEVCSRPCQDRCRPPLVSG